MEVVEGEQRSSRLSRRSVSKPARYKDDNDYEWEQLPKGVVTYNNNGGGSKSKSPPPPSATDITTQNNIKVEEGAAVSTTSIARSIPSSVSPLPNKAEKIVGVVQSLMASDELSLAELRNKGRDDIKAIVRQSNILFGNQFWQGIKSLLHAAIDASEEENNNDGTKVRRVVDRDALLRLYASSCCDSTNVSSSLPIVEMDAKARKKKKTSSTAIATSSSGMGEGKKKQPSPRSAAAARALSSLFSTDVTSSSDIPTLQETSIEDVMAEAAAAAASSSTSSSGGGGNTKLSKLPKKSLAIMEKWIQDNTANPYPTKEEKDVLVQSTGLLKKQIESWMEKYRRQHG